MPIGRLQAVGCGLLDGQKRRRVLHDEVPQMTDKARPEGNDIEQSHAMVELGRALQQQVAQVRAYAQVCRGLGLVQQPQALCQGKGG